MKHLRFQLWSEPVSSSNIEFFVYKQNQCGWEAEELGQKTASSLFWYSCLFRASHLFTVKVGLVKQYDSPASVQFSEILCCCCCCCIQDFGSSLKPCTEDDYLISVFYTCSLGVCLCSKKYHTDNSFIRQPPLWSSFYSPSWCTFIHFNYCPICSSMPC